MTTTEDEEENNFDNAVIELAEKYSNEVRVCIAVQKLGKATSKEIEKKLLSDKIALKIKAIDKACTNLQKRGIFSLNYDNSSGYAVKAYSLAKSIFSRDIPIAHYADIVDTNDPEIKKLLVLLDEKKNMNKGRLPDHRDYFKVNVKFKVKDYVLGFMPFTEEGFNQHYRQGKNIIFLAQHFRAWFSHNLRLRNKSESLKNYIGFDYGLVELPKGKETEIQEFTIEGRGIIKYEALPSGTIISTSFNVPSSDFTEKEFMSFLKQICENPLRGFGGRSMTGYGRLELM